VLNLLNCLQWRAQNFRMGGVEVTQSPSGWGVDRGYPTPHLWGKDLLPRKVFVFFVENRAYHILTHSDTFIS